MRDDERVDTDRTRVLMALLAATGWVDDARLFAGTLRRSAEAGRPGELLLVGTPGFEPWHFAAHLGDEARLVGRAELAPTLVRWHVPDGAPAHLAVPLHRLEVARRGETLLVVSDERAPAPLLERAWDARKAGATVLALDAADPELAGVAHQALDLPARAPDGLSFDAAQHIVSVAAGEAPGTGMGTRPGDRSSRRGVRDRLARLLDGISGPPPDRLR